jgi:exodeoxyribonuclease VII large subunit
VGGERTAHRVEALASQLVLVSPEAVLARGYAIVRRSDGSVVRDATQAPPGTGIAVRVARGEFRARVDPDSGDSDGRGTSAQ